MNIRWSAYDDNTVEVFYREGVDPDIYTVEQFIAVYGEDALPSVTSLAEFDVVDDYSEYWSAAIDLVNAWARFQGKRKLYGNSDREGARYKVEHVIIRYYDGDVGKLLRHEHSLAVALNYALVGFERQCSRYNVGSVNIVWLELHLQEDRHYKSLRAKCQRRRDKNKPPTPLNELL